MNETPRANPRKTKSALKRPLLIALLLVLAVAAILAGRTDTTDTSDTITLGDTLYRIETASTPEAQVKGLSGRSGLAAGTGMLFSYEDSSEHCMWMKDMKFNIDIVWFDDSQRITSIVPDLPPDTYPQSYCARGKTVLELPAGTAAKHGLRVGQIIKF